MSKNIEKVRATYSNVGPTSDNSSRIAIMKKIQVKVGSNKAQLWGLNDLKDNESRAARGYAGDQGIRTKFAAIFPRFSV